ncbi:MAG: C25 family cysteine peptidase [Bacteroidota bacterium]
MKLIFTFSAVIIAFSTIFSQEFSILKNNDKEVEVRFKNDLRPFVHTTINGQNYVDFTKSYKVTSLEKGNPALPTFGESFVIPNTGVTNIELSYDEIITLENISISPSKGNLKRNVNPEDVAYTFSDVYSRNEFYPSQIAQVQEPFILRSIRGQVLSLTPYQYNPVSKTLKIYTNLKAKLTFDNEQIGFNEISTSEINFNDKKAFQNIFINDIPQAKYNQVEEEGELLIIAQDSYLSTIEPLINWKKQKGIVTYFVPTGEAGSQATAIKSYIQNFYAEHPQLRYVLLVGDHQQVPSYSYGTSGEGEALISDSYFGQMTSDYYPELFVGRFSGTTAQVDVMVQRTLEYEKNPLAGNWMTKAIGLASGEGNGIGDEGEADWEHMRGIRTQLLDFGYTDVKEFYDGSRGQADASGNPSSSIILPAVNSGVGLFNYTGHGDINTCVTGNFNSTNINAATNNGSYPFVISVACNNGSFNTSTCISEAWLRATENNTPSGAIAACGSSILMSWAPPMQTQDEMTNLITEVDPNNKKTSLGGLFYNAQLSMFEEYTGYGPEVMQTWVFFGDPSVEFRDKITQDLAVVHLTETPAETATTLEFTSITEGALVSIVQDSIFLGKALVNGGVCSIAIPALDPFSPITVTATKQNYKPYIGTINLITVNNDVDGDGFINTVDCNDNNASIHSGAIEIANNGIDEDCSGADLITDIDGDGFLGSNDCNENDATIHPGATEIANNGVDEDCNGVDLINSASVIDVSKSKFNVYPNPSSKILTVSSLELVNYNLKITDLSGKIVYSETVNENNLSKQIDISSFANGMYTLSILEGNSIFKEKIVIQK